MPKNIAGWDPATMSPYASSVEAICRHVESRLVAVPTFVEALGLGEVAGSYVATDADLSPDAPPILSITYYFTPTAD